MSPSVEPFNEAKYKALMDGLECSETQLSNVRNATDYFRIEAEYHTAKTIVYQNSNKGKDVISKIQYGTSKFCDEDPQGYPVLRLNELNNGFIEIPQKYCHIISDEEFESLRLHKGDVVIIRTNGNPNLVGRSAVILEETNMAFASYLYRVVPNEKINSETLVSYLNCKYGRKEIDKNSMKGNQTNFSPAKFRDITIPDFGNAFQVEIRRTIEQAYCLRKAANSHYRKASKTLIMCFCLDNLTTSGISTKPLSESFGTSGRLDAEYYQPKYDTLFEALANVNTKKLGGTAGIVTIKKSIEPGSAAYVDDGIPFVRVSDMNKYEITEPEIKLDPKVILSPAKLFPKKDTILFSKDGSVGIAYKVDADMVVITSGALLHLTVRNTSEVLPDYLTLVLNSPVVQLQAERDSNGAIIQHWKPSEIENVVIPVLNMEIQKEIAAKVQESFALRKKSKQLLEYAKQAVEMAIEKGEDVALEWLKDKAD